MRGSILALAVWLAAACAPSGGGPGAVAPVAPAVVAPPNPAPAPHTPEVQRLLTAARAAGETELHLSWSEATLGGHEGARRLAELFNRTYDTDVKVSFTPGRLDQITLRLGQEAASGRRAIVDLLVGSDTHVSPLLQQDALEPYDYTLLSPRITPDLLVPGSMAVQVASRIAGITYHTGQVPAADLPRRLEDVLDPRWKGIIAATQTAIGFDSVAYRPEWTPDRMRGFVGRLSEQVGGLVRPGEQERVASGEFVMLVLNTGSMEVHRLRARGAPVGHVIPDDASIMSFHYAGVPRHSARPNLAKLFVNVLLSEEGQQLLFETAYYDLHKLPGARTAAELSDVRARGIRPLEVDVQFVLDHPDTAVLQDELTRVLVERQGR